MSPTTIRSISLTVVTLSAVSLLSACNVDWIPADRQALKLPPKTARPAIRGGTDLAVVQRREVDLVESVLSHRAAYERDLAELEGYYAASGHAQKRSWAAYELADSAKVRKFRYLIDAEIPSDALRAVESIPEADALFEDAMSLMQKGGHKVPFFYRKSAMLRAAEAFRTLIERFPSSDKIDDAAFFSGDIHKEYLSGQESLAVKWYERAWAWNPDTPHPARFNAAVVYDYRLHDRDRALELYHQVITQEADADQSNVRFATRRIAELTESPVAQPARQ